MKHPQKPLSMKFSKFILEKFKINKSERLITLTTDFGTADVFVACMKGVILGINPKARIVDITHEIPPFDVEKTTFLIQSFVKDFPEQTIHMIIVDPGVGSSRRGLLVQSGETTFLAPDNGLLTPIIMNDQYAEVREIDAHRFLRQSPGETFHGRDLFAPVAAMLSMGDEPKGFGSVYQSPICLSFPLPIQIDPNRIKGEIIYIDYFGNLFSNITRSFLEEVGWDQNLEQLEVSFDGRHQGRILKFYSGVQEGEAGALINSFGYLEWFCNKENARDRFSAKIGTPIELRLCQR